MNRNEIIKSLDCPSDAECDRINSRLQQCNLRVVRTDGSVEHGSDVRTRLQLQQAMLDDETIERIEYRYNGEWKTAYCS